MSSAGPISAKGLGFAEFIDRKNPNAKILAKIARRWTNQATNQVNASSGRPIVWYFAEKSALEYANICLPLAIDSGRTISAQSSRSRNRRYTCPDTMTNWKMKSG
jgi:hypothetical protein